MTRADHGGRPRTEAEVAAIEVDDFHVHGRELYWLTKDKQSESTFSNGLFERTVKVRATFRGIGTVTRLVATLGFRPAAG